MLLLEHDRFASLDDDELLLSEQEQFEILDGLNPLNFLGLSEETKYNNKFEKLKFEICDVDKYVKANNFQEITNPVTFGKGMVPTPDGLLSNEIFGITKEERAGIFGYIDLKGTFIDPSCYKEWCRLDSKIKSIVHGTDTFSINEKGEIVQDPRGKNGIDFLKKNIDKITFRRTGSLDRDLRIDYIKKNKKRMFITKYLVIPPYYRDVNTSDGKSTGVGFINKVYSNLIRYVQSLQSTRDYGFDDSSAIVGRIQETLLMIYDWFAGNNNPSIGPKDSGTGMSGKFGLIRRVNRSKTVDFASRLVMSAYDLKVETLDDMMVDMEYSAMPLAATIANYYPFMLFHVKRFFENQFGELNNTIPLMKNGKVIYGKVVDPLIQFSDERITKELKNFLHSFNNRFVPVEAEVELEDGTTTTASFAWAGKYVDPLKASTDGRDEMGADYTRRLTWCDIFYIAAVEATKNGHIMITRYPIDKYFNEFFTKVRVSSTKKTKCCMIKGELYRWYPDIKEEDIGTNTGNRFVDTMIISNLFLEECGGDYDGDTCIVRGVYTEEANEEIEKHIYSKKNLLDLAGKNIRISTKDAIQSLYELTRTLPDQLPKLSDPVF